MLHKLDTHPEEGQDVGVIEGCLPLLSGLLAPKAHITFTPHTASHHMYINTHFGYLLFHELQNVHTDAAGRESKSAIYLRFICQP